MKYKVILTNKAEKQLRKIDSSIQKRLVKKMEQLVPNPRMIGVKKLKGEDNFYRVREGNYRIIYAIQDTELLIVVINVGHRRDIY